jgi:predicted O-methyltransferase YrrM
MAEGTVAGDLWCLRLEEDYQVRLATWSDIAEQMPLLRDAARRYTRPAIAELGTRTGQSTSALLTGASASGGHVWSVDCGPVYAPYWWRETGLWSFLAADDMSDEAAAFIPAALDILFIDTSHLFWHTLAELHKYVPRVRSGGMVLMHDTELTIEQMVAYGEWSAVHGPEYPVAAALDAFCAAAGLSWTRQAERPAPTEGMPFYGLGTIKIPEAS